MLYTESPGGSTDAVERHVSFAQLTCLNVALQAEVGVKKIPKSRTDFDGLTKADPIRRDDMGSWWQQRAITHQSRSVLPVFSCRRFASINSGLAKTTGIPGSWDSRSRDCNHYSWLRQQRDWLLPWKTTTDCHSPSHRL